jgi:hypothetical protein
MLADAPTSIKPPYRTLDAPADARRVCRRRASWWWPWSKPCTLKRDPDGCHDGPCSFEILRARMDANFALLKADETTQVSREPSMCCSLCGELRYSIWRTRLDTKVSHAGESHVIRMSTFHGTVCFRCADVREDGKLDGPTMSIVEYLAKAGPLRSSAQPVLAAALDRMKADVERLQKLVDSAGPP